MKNILVIGSKDVGSKNDPAVIAQAIQTDKSAVQLAYWEEMLFDIQTGYVSISCGDTNLDTLSIDLVLAFGWYKNGDKSIYRDIAYSFAKYLEHRRIPVWNSEIGTQRSMTKLSCMVELALQNIPVPHTTFSLSKRHLESASLPCIAKAPAASRGSFNYLVQDETMRQKILEAKQNLLVQDFLPNDHDLRVICFGGEPKLVMKRSRQSSETHLNNTSQGGIATWLSLDSLSTEILTMCRKICNNMHRELAGIDLIPDRNSPVEYSCLEVNAIPQLTSGTDATSKMDMLRKTLEEMI